MSAWTQASPPSGPNFLATFPVIPSSHMPWGEGTIPLPGKTKHIRASWLLSLLLLSWWPFFLSPHLATFLSISHANYLFLYYGIWHILTSKVPLLLKSSINISGTAYCLQLVYIHSRFSFIPFDLSHIQYYILHLLKGMLYSENSWETSDIVACQSILPKILKRASKP